MNSLHSMGLTGTSVYLGLATLGIASLLVLILTMVAFFRKRSSAAPPDRSLAAQKAPIDTACESSLHLRTLVEAIPQMIWTATADGSRDYFNQRWCDYTGLSLEQATGHGWEAALHPDDLDLSRKKWVECVQTGEGAELEYRLRRAEYGTYHWHLARALPLRSPEGNIVKWFGTCTNIDDQKHSQEILEQQIKERTEELTAANENLKREMWEREQVQNDLDQQNVAMVAEITKRSERTVLLSKMGKLLQSAINMDEAVSIILGFAPKIFPD